MDPDAQSHQSHGHRVSVRRSKPLDIPSDVRPAILCASDAVRESRVSRCSGVGVDRGAGMHVWRASSIHVPFNALPSHDFLT